MQELKFKHNSFRAKPIRFRLVESKYINPLHILVSDVPIILMQLKYMTRIIISRSTFTEIIINSSTSQSIL
jgi:hypothetical protein